MGRTTTQPTGRRAYHRVTVLNPNTAPPVNGDAVLDPWVPATPPYWFVALEPTIGADQERLRTTGVLSQASLTVTGAYRPDVSTASQLVDENGRILSVLGVECPGRRKFELVLECSEVVA